MTQKSDSARLSPAASRMSLGSVALWPLRQPVVYLVLLLALSLSSTVRLGYLEPEVTNDTQGYVWLLEAETLEQKLSGLRTYGYPLLLRAVGLTSPPWESVPELHFAVYAASVLFFWFALARFSRSPWLALAASVPLAFSAAVPHVRMVVTDSFGESLGLASVSLLLLFAAAGRRARPWLGLLLGLVVFATYFVRPIYQYLLLLLPLLGVALRLCHAPREPVRWVRTTLVLAAIASIPWLAASSIRWQTTGHFGIASQGGYCLGAIGALFLDDELVAELPADQRELAREMLKQRRWRKWRPMGLDSWPPPYQRQYGLTMFQIAEPIATRIVLEEEGRIWNEDLSTDLGPLDVPGMIGPTALQIDARLGEFGKSAIRRRPALYLKWIYDGFSTAVRKALDDTWLRLLLLLTALSIPPLLLRLRTDPALARRDRSEGGRTVLAVALLGLTYFMGHTLVIILIHWPKDRYAVAANLLLPSILAAGLFEIWRRILTPAPAAGRSDPGVGGRPR